MRSIIKSIAQNINGFSVDKDKLRDGECFMFVSPGKTFIGSRYFFEFIRYFQRIGKIETCCKSIYGKPDAVCRDLLTTDNGIGLQQGFLKIIGRIDPVHLFVKIRRHRLSGRRQPFASLC